MDRLQDEVEQEVQEILNKLKLLPGSGVNLDHFHVLFPEARYLSLPDKRMGGLCSVYSRV